MEEGTKRYVSEWRERALILSVVSGCPLLRGASKHAASQGRWWWGRSRRVTITVALTITTTQRWSGVCQVMSFALSLGVADGGARLLIGDQASDQDWVFNVPETTDKGTFLALLLDSAVFPFAKLVRRRPLSASDTCSLARPPTEPPGRPRQLKTVCLRRHSQSVRQSVPCQLEFPILRHG